MHTRAGHGLVTIQQILAFPEGVEEYCHGADIEGVSADPQQVVEDTGHLIEHDADILGPYRRLQAEEFFDGQHITVLVTHHGDVIEPVHVTDALVIRFIFSEFFGCAMQQTDVRIGAFDHLAVQFQHQPQHAMGGGMLWPEIHGVVSDFRHSYSPVAAS